VGNSLVAWITGSPHWESLDYFVIPAIVVTYVTVTWIWPRALKPFFWWMTHFCWRMKVIGRENIPTNTGAILVSQHVSYIDWLLIFAAAPRQVRVLVWSGYRRNLLARFFLSWVRAIPIDNRKPTIDGIEAAFSEAEAALRKGQLVLIFAEGRLSRSGFMRPFHRGLEVLYQRVPVPIIPVALMNVWGSVFSYHRGRTIWKWPERIPRRLTVGFGKPLPPGATAPQVRQEVLRVGAYCHRHGNHWGKPLHRDFVRNAARHPFRSCMIDALMRRELNYGKTLAGAMCLRNWLKPRLGKEPMVGLWLPSSVGGALANIVLALLRKTSVNLNYTAPVESIRSSIRQTGIRQVLTSRKFVEKMPFDPAQFENVDVIYLEDAQPDIKKWQQVLAFLQVVLLPGWILENVCLGLGGHKLDDLATIIFSSGTTGEPKGVMLSHRNIAANVDSITYAVDLMGTDRLLGALPFFHSFGYTVTLWAPLVVGASTVYYADPRQAKEIGELCRKYSCTIMLTTPTFLRFYLKRSEPDDYRTLRLFVCGAEKLPPSLAAAFKERFGVLPLEGYGCTETAPIISANVPDIEIKGVRQVGNRIGTIGQTLPGIAAKIVDSETYEELPFGHDGMLLVTGANIMVGYHGKPEKTASVIRDGWYVTGDVGHMDPDGFITLTGRESRFAKVGGEMVPLEKVEEELHAALSTTDRYLAVTAIPDEAKGERLIVLHLPLQGVDVRQLCGRMSERNLPNLWLPKERDFIEIPEIPVLGSGKLDLKRLKQVASERLVQGKSAG
jgi:acyl-[acyl-carrier-protein]-phospholipid O-acyltransferase/long-chain-fatty-acid--[acyl-carrier-protein] ligase